MLKFYNKFLKKKKVRIGNVHSKVELKYLKQRLLILGYKSYYSYLRSDLWVNFKKTYFIKNKIKKCAKCEATEFLSLHHRTYIRLGKEKFSDIILLCSKCHKRKHNILN